MCTPVELIYDVVIVGGGVAGCSTALSLFRSNPQVSVLLFDNTDPTSYKIGESLPAGAKRILAYLSPDLLPRLLRGVSDGVHTPCTGNASAWTTSDLEETHAIMNPFGMGWHLDRSVFDELMRDTVRDTIRGSCTVTRDAFTSIKRTTDPEGWIVTVEDPDSRELKRYRTRWVVDATGRKASLARKLGAKTVKTDSLLAFYALFVSSSTVQDDDFRTVIEASESGWWYTSQLANNRRVVVYHTDSSDPSSKQARKQDGFLDLLHTQTLNLSRLISEGDYEILVDPHTRFPKCTAAGSSYLEPCCDHSFVAVGDAAMAFDPLSSQGIITALKMGCAVGDALAQEFDVKLGNENQTGMRLIPRIYEVMRSKYEKEKTYFYSQMTRFEGNFWERRVNVKHVVWGDDLY